MSNFQEFPAKLLRLAPRQSIASSPDGGALANINTTLLADGALCWVTSAGTDFRLDRFSVATPDGTTIIAPDGGPGRWLRVSASSQLAYGWVKRASSAQANIQSGVDLEPNTLGTIVGGISYDFTNNNWILEAGKTYLLTASANFDTFSDDAAGRIDIQWVDDTDTPLVDGTADCMTSRFVPSTFTGDTSGGGPLLMVYTPPDTPQARTVKVRCTGSGTGTASLRQGGYVEIVQQISG